MSRSNCMSPGRGAVATIQNSHRSGKFRTFNSDTSGSTKNSGRPGNKVSWG